MSEKTAADTQPFNNSGFRAYLAEQRLMAARCKNCGKIHLPPRVLCPRCYSTDMEWVALSGEGSLAGFTTIHVGLPEMAAEGYNREKPYCTGIVRLAEGPAISGQIIGVDGTCPESIEVGMPLRAAFLERGPDKQVILAFERREDSKSSND